MKYSTECLKHIFTEDEKEELAAEMARKVIDLKQLEDYKKAFIADFSSRIERTKAQIHNAATKLNDGYEMRSIKCEIRMDYTKKIVQFLDIETKEILKERMMRDDEMQMEMEAE